MTNELTKKTIKEDIGTTTEKASQTPDCLIILAQAFYGNRTMTEIRPEDMDRFVLGYLDSSLEISEPIDRTVVRIPGSDNLVLVYNRYQEEERLKEGEKLLREENYEIKPLAVIPEINLTLYSRCIALRMNEDGSFASLQEGDSRILVKYLAG